MAKRPAADHTPEADAVPGRPVVPRHFTQTQILLVDLISSRFCGRFCQALGRYRRTRVNARLLGAEALPFWTVLNCLPFGCSTALARCKPSGECCLIEVGRELLEAFCGEGTRTYEVGKASAVAESHPEGFYAVPVAETNATGCLVIPPRVVHAVKNGGRTLEVVAVAIESTIPAALYSMLFKAWKWAWAKIPSEFEILGYDHDFHLLEQFMPPLTPMIAFVLEVRIGGSLGIIKVSVPESILNSEKVLAKTSADLVFGRGVLGGDFA